MLAVDITATWIPLSMIAVLCAYMVVLFQRERHMVHSFESEGGDTALAVTAPATTTMTGEAAMVETTTATPQVFTATPDTAPSHAPAASHPTAQANPEVPAGSLLWNTAYLWLPFVAGFGWQAYLDFFKAWLEKTIG